MFFSNAAPCCVLTLTYEELNTGRFGLVASPCDQFGRQDPNSNAESFKLTVHEGPRGVDPFYQLLSSISPKYTAVY